MSERPEPVNYFEQRVRDKAQKENISEDEARRLLLQEVKDRLAGKYSTNPKSERTMPNAQDDNVHDLFGTKRQDAPKTDKSKNDTKFDKVLNDYEFHLTSILKYGSYGNCHEPSEVAKMADIKSCINKSAHPRMKTIESLFTQVVDLIKKNWGDNGYAEWVKAINDELEHRQILDNLNALTCSTAQWSDRDSEGKLKPPILRAIVAIRYLLEQRHYVLREDVWKAYSVIMDAKNNELYSSVQTDSILREWRNWIYERKGTMHTQEIMKDAYHQISKVNEFHSRQEKIASIKWDGIDRYEAFATAFGLKIDDFTVRVIKQHLIASVARVFHPGVWYDLVLCTFGAQGAGKTTGLRILYGHDNIISCNFFELDPKVQSEKTRHGINAVENADTFGDARKADFNRIKADVSTDSFLGRDASGRVEDMRRHKITYVIWYTGNEIKVLRDHTGNRRFIIVYSIGPIDEDWLRLNAGQLWAQAYADEEKLRSEYLEAQRIKGIVDDYPKYLELPHDLWDESKRRAGNSMVINEQLEDWIPDVIFQDFVMWPDEKNDKKSIYVYTKDILKYLQDNGCKGSISDQVVSAAMNRHVVLEKGDCDGLEDDIRWENYQIKRNHKNRRGYHIAFVGEAKLRAFEIIKGMVKYETKSSEDAFIEANKPL